MSVEGRNSYNETGHKGLKIVLSVILIVFIHTIAYLMSINPYIFGLSRCIMVKIHVVFNL